MDAAAGAVDGVVILIVDDDPTNLAVLSRVLRPRYRVRAAVSGAEALRVAASVPKPELILLDLMMPGMDGYETLERLRADPATADIPVVFLTAMADSDHEERGLQRGAADYLTKPIRSAIVHARVRTQLEAKRARDLLRDQNAALEAEVQRRMRENDRIQTVSVRALAYLAEARDTDTGLHIHRTQAIVAELARLMQGDPAYAPHLTQSSVELLVRSAPLHDIGKVGIPDSVLLKPGPLTPEERAVMQRHAVIGASAIERAEADVGTRAEFLSIAKEIVRWHHERWDGSGYPDGLVGDAIPVAARLMALADVFDALISKRVYKSAMRYEQARQVIADGRATHFDPRLTDVFLEHYERFVAIAERSAAARADSAGTRADSAA